MFCLLLSGCGLALPPMDTTYAFTAHAQDSDDADAGTFAFDGSATINAEQITTPETPAPLDVGIGYGVRAGPDISDHGPIVHLTFPWNRASTIDGSSRIQFLLRPRMQWLLGDAAGIRIGFQWITRLWMRVPTKHFSRSRAGSAVAAYSGKGQVSIGLFMGVHQTFPQSAAPDYVSFSMGLIIRNPFAAFGAVGFGR